VATVHITEPASGDQFESGKKIPIRATAIHLESYISRVEFWDGESLLGVSEIVFVRAPDPGTPIHHQFDWEGAEPGNHVLTARAATLNGLSAQGPDWGGGRLHQSAPARCHHCSRQRRSIQGEGTVEMVVRYTRVTPPG